MRFNQMPMIWKVLSLLLALSAVSVVAVAFASAQMLSITHAYDDALRGPARANVALSRAGRHAVWTSRSILKLITAQSPQAREAAEKDVQSGRASFNTEIGTAIATMPSRRAEFEALRTSYDGILNSTCFQTVNLAKSGEAGAVSHMNEHCGPELLTVITSLSKMVDETIVANETLVERLQAQADRAVAITVGAVLGGLVLVMGVAFWLTRSGIVAPLKALTETMVSMSKGHLSIKVPGEGRRDELGAMARTVEVFRKGLEETERLRANAAEAEKANELRLRQERNAIADEFQARMGSLAEAFVKSSGEVSGAAQSLAATAEETSRQAQVVSGAAEEAAVSVQTAAAATEEMTASIREINEQVVKAANVAAEASDEAAHTETEIRALNDAAQQIGEVVNLINDIASQTNLLALNATIEAARAGEAGKGFAVVASEVKQLATQTARATQDIGNKVTEIQSATDRTVGSIEKIVITIADIRAISANVAAAVEEQGAATSEIAGNTARAADGTVQVTENIFGVGRAAEMTGAASTQLMGLSGNLSQSANDLEQEVKNFVTQLRSA